MADLEFFTDQTEINLKRGFVVRIANVENKETLLDTIGFQLRFPDYYRRNWDSLEECLQNLAWIEEREVLLIHDTLPSLSETDLRTYLQILLSAVETWKPEDDHQLRVLFSKLDIEEIHSLLA